MEEDLAYSGLEIVGVTSYLLQPGPLSSDHATAYSEVPNHFPEIHVFAQRESATPGRGKAVMGGREDGDAESAGRASKVSTFDRYHFIRSYLLLAG